MPTQVGLFLMYLLQFLPLPVQAAFGTSVGYVLYWLIPRRRRVALINLRLCFPEMTEGERRKLARANFAVLARSVLERALLWWAPQQRIDDLIRLEGEEHLKAVLGTPVILLVPHFAGMELGWAKLTQHYLISGFYATQKNFHFNAALLHGRARFGESAIIGQAKGLAPAVSAIKQGLPFYYLPDMDFSRPDTIFVPFFGHPAATITTVSRIARITGAKIVPLINCILPGGKGYVVKLYPAWDNFPGESVEEDTRRMNKFIEDRVREIPEQYYWVHRRFKTRPEGEKKIY
jgi:Kdo2-lipid IVA lauroyltransferase/acyltransferase